MSLSGSRPRSRRTPSPPSARPSGSVRVVIAEGHAIDRRALVCLLRGEPGFDVLGEASNSAEAIELCASLRPDVLLLTVNLPGEGANSALPVIHASLPGLRILALSERGVDNCLVLNPPGRRRLAANSRLRPCESGTDCLQLAMAQGALGTVRRSADPAALFRALRAVASGQASFEPRTAVAAAAEGTATEANGLPELSARELDVAALVGEGRSNKEISATLSISQATVKKHVSQILRKLSLQDRLQVGLFVARHPLLFSGD